MADAIAAHAELARKGVDKFVPIYAKDPMLVYPKMGFESRSTTQPFERYYQEGGFPYATVVAEQAQIPVTSIFTGYNKDYYLAKRGLGYKCSFEKLETDQYGVMDRTSRKMAIAMNKTKEVTAANLFNNMTSTGAAYVGADAVALVSASHPYNGGTWSNRGTGASNTDVDLSYTALEDAIAKLMDTVDREGIPDPVRGSFKLLVPNELWGLAMRLKKDVSPKMPGGNDNDGNVAGGMISDVVVNPWLTDADAWMLISDNPNSRHLFQLTHGSRRAQKKIYEETEEVAFFLTEKWLFHYDDARGVWGTVGA